MEVFLPYIYHFYCTHCLGNQDRVCSWHHSDCLGSRTSMCQCTDTCVDLHLVYETTNLQYTVPLLLLMHDTETARSCISQLQHIQELYLWDVTYFQQHNITHTNIMSISLISQIWQVVNKLSKGGQGLIPGQSMRNLW